NPCKGEDHRPYERPIAKPNEASSFDRIEQQTCRLSIEYGRLTLLDRVLRRPNRRSRIHRNDLSNDHPIEQAPNSGDMLLYRGHSEFTHQGGLDVACNVEW